ncbi:MAG: hypothetical protein HY904_18295 [Deltaproteobacteria bacterium]|nr:hypothetical protein [Deltaproteobacteria bacterium]
MSRTAPRLLTTLRLQLQFGGSEVETATDTVAAGGFSALCLPAPAVDSQCSFVLHLPDGHALRGTARCTRTTSDGVSGFAATFQDADAAGWQSFLSAEDATAGVWRMIGRYATSQGQDKEAARSALEKGPLGVLFKRVGGTAEPAATVAPVTDAHGGVLRLHVVGENGEAYRVAFEKHVGAIPEDCDLATLPGFLELAARTVARVLPRDLLLRRSPTARVTSVRVVELLRGGYAMVANAPPAPLGLVGLHGHEMIAVERDGKAVFPFFDADDLERIAADTLRRESRPVPREMTPRSVRPERFAAHYTHLDPGRARALDALRRALTEASHVERRTYGTRSVQLYPGVWLQVQRDATDQVLGFAMTDGEDLCVFVMEGPGAPRVMKLRPDDVVSVMRASAAG